MQGQRARLTGEQLVALPDGRRFLPGAPSARKLRYWYRNGLRSETGQRVFLETVKIGGTRYTSVEAFERFVAALSSELQ